jgi:hypothetical protein
MRIIRMKNKENKPVYYDSTGIICYRLREINNTLAKELYEINKSLKSIVLELENMGDDLS